MALTCGASVRVATTLSLSAGFLPLKLGQTGKYWPLLLTARSWNRQEEPFHLVGGPIHGDPVEAAPASGAGAVKQAWVAAKPQQEPGRVRREGHPPRRPASSPWGGR